jgi:hypothetical protein
VAKKGMKLPTERQVLQAIFDAHYGEYLEKLAGEDRSAASLESVYVPIDMAKIADGLKVPVPVLFGYLFNHLNLKHPPRQDRGEFYEREIDGKRDMVNFPVLIAILASLQREHEIAELSLSVATIAAVFAGLAVIVLPVLSALGKG